MEQMYHDERSSIRWIQLSCSLMVSVICVQDQSGLFCSAIRRATSDLPHSNHLSDSFYSTDMASPLGTFRVLCRLNTTKPTLVAMPHCILHATLGAHGRY